MSNMLSQRLLHFIYNINKTRKIEKSVFRRFCTLSEENSPLDRNNDKNKIIMEKKPDDNIIMVPKNKFTQPIKDFFKYEIYHRYIKFADCAYSEESAEELNDWTTDLVQLYQEDLSKSSLTQTRSTELEVYQETEMEYDINESYDEKPNSIQRYIQTTLDSSFSIDVMKYNLQRFIIPGIINGIIDDKTSLIESWLTPQTIDIIQHLKSIKSTIKHRPDVIHIVDVSDPVGVRHNSQYMLRYTFHIVYRFIAEDGTKTPIIDKMSIIDAIPDHTSYPNSPLMWKMSGLEQTIYLLYHHDK